MVVKNATQLSLPLEVIDVHCFFGCPYIACSSDPQEAHNLMEHHYTEKHSQQIDRIVGRTIRQPSMQTSKHDSEGK